MANHKSSIKRARQTTVRTARNRVVKTRIKSLRKKTLEAVEKGDKQTAQATARELTSAVDKAAKKHLFHCNKAANIKSRTAKAIAKLG